ncbi:hypothetical protein ABTN69_19885, partial [Acinetobacter baumannii]
GWVSEDFSEEEAAVIAEASAKSMNLDKGAVKISGGVITSSDSSVSTVSSSSSLRHHNGHQVSSIVYSLEAWEAVKVFSLNYGYS